MKKIRIKKQSKEENGGSCPPSKRVQTNENIPVFLFFSIPILAYNCELVQTFSM